MNFQQNNLNLSLSPYLLSHKENPVWWQMWQPEVLAYAKSINKPLLISIGYSACHWCHVMEKENFEDQQVANWMNENFVCIKIDREERPDLDAIYMNAVHLIQQNGGWPLHAFTFPDGRPFYGGTYFPKTKWLDIIGKLSEMYVESVDELESYADQLAKGIQRMETIFLEENAIDNKHDVQTVLENISSKFDATWGGLKNAPKFVTPIVWEALLMGNIKWKNAEIKNQINLTLERISWGGLNDFVGGGFSRYSVDPYWKVPHFEKMLYDNAQLLSLFAHAYQIEEKTAYKSQAEAIFTWLNREMLGESGLYYSAQDADSEGEEGKFYVWTELELKSILLEDYMLFSQFFNVGKDGFWEEDKNILFQTKSIEMFCVEHSVEFDFMLEKLNSWQDKLFLFRKDRMAPALDDKCITSWNAMLVCGLLDCYKAFGDVDFFNHAKKNLDFLLDNMWQEETVYRIYKDGQVKIEGFLEDYAQLLRALLNYFQISGDKKYFDKIEVLTAEIFAQFFSYKNKMFGFQSHYQESLLVQTFEVYDSVIPSSNSVMADNLFVLGKIKSNQKYIEQSQQMLANMTDQMLSHPAGMCGWFMVYLKHTQKFHEIVVSGPNSKDWSKEILKNYNPFSIVCIHLGEPFLEIFNERFNHNQNLVYVCEGNQCLLPIDNLEEFIFDSKK